MTLLKIFAIVFGATGFWKLIEILLQFRTQKRLKNAEINNLNTQANSLIIENYKLWTENMDTRIKELENKNTSMGKTITQYRSRIIKLESNNAEMNLTITKQRDRITELESEIQEYKKAKQ